MYVGVSSNCPGALSTTEKSGLFVERFQSPYTEVG
jgi:hypothetical protein